jgi:PKD domain
MARKDILPSYLSQAAWIDLCNAVDVVFANRVDRPTQNLGKIRRTHIISSQGRDKIEEGVLLNPLVDLDTFETEVLLKQVNSSGLIITAQGFFTVQDLARIFRSLPHFWYSKGKSSVQDFLSYVFNLPITFKQLWTEDYSEFLAADDVGIGTPVYEGGTWYPTTHVRIEVEGYSLPGGIPLEIFAKLIEELINYPLVPVYSLVSPNFILTSTTGPFVPVLLAGRELQTHILPNFVISAEEQSSDNGGGGEFEVITGLCIPGPYGVGYTPPTPPVANISASVVSGAAPLAVEFVNTSTGHCLATNWDFNSSGVIDSHQHSVTHVFSNPGVYATQMTVFNEVGSDAFSITITVT